MVRGRRRLQRHGDGAAGPQSGGPVQLLLSQVQPEDGPAAGRSNGEAQVSPANKGFSRDPELIRLTVVCP